MSTLGLIFVFWAQFLTKRRHFRPDPFLSCAERWQDSRAVHDLRGPCSEKRLFLARSSRGVSSDGDLRGISDAWRADLARASPFSDAWCANLATNWRFFPSEATFGMHEAKKLPRIDARERTVAKSCHYQSPENAFRAYPAIAGCLGMHSVDILPSADIRECAVSAYLHCRSSGRATFSTRGSGFRPLAALWGSARNTFCAREWAFRLLGA